MELASLFKDWRIEIIGTDISRRSLESARKGSFEAWSLRGMSEELRERYFEKRGKSWVIRAAYREGVTFQHHNLVSDHFPSLAANLFGFDLIVCRNVMIYFDTATVTRLAGQFEQSLRPDGWLAVGHAEPHTEIFQRFETVNTPGAILYRRGRNPGASLVPGANVSVQSILAVPSAPPAVVVEGAPISKAGLRENAPVAAESPRIEMVRDFADRGELEKALEACRQLLAMKKLSSELHLLHGLLLQQMGNVAGAREAVQKSIYLEPDNALAHYHLGAICRSAGAKAEAMKCFRNAGAQIERKPDDAPIRYGDGMTVADMKALIEHELSATV
jgi:chemotaxis protein methyltransferase CheR